MPLILKLGTAFIKFYLKYSAHSALDVTNPKPFWPCWWSPSSSGLNLTAELCSREQWGAILMLLCIFPNHRISTVLIIIDPCVLLLHLGIIKELVAHKIAPAQLSLNNMCDKKLPKFINVIENAAIRIVMDLFRSVVFYPFLYEVLFIFLSFP